MAAMKLLVCLSGSSTSVSHPTYTTDSLADIICAKCNEKNQQEPEESVRKKPFL
jgi:hypothetical protein